VCVCGFIFNYNLFHRWLIIGHSDTGSDVIFMCDECAREYDVCAQRSSIEFTENVINNHNVATTIDDDNIDDVENLNLTNEYRKRVCVFVCFDMHTILFCLCFS
jgi:hypothetical protein